MYRLKYDCGMEGKLQRYYKNQGEKKDLEWLEFTVENVKSALKKGFGYEME